MSSRYNKYDIKPLNTDTYNKYQMVNFDKPKKETNPIVKKIRNVAVKTFSLLLAGIIGLSPIFSYAEEYTIQKGDTLSKIASAYGVSVDELAKLNNIEDVNKIYAGHKLTIDGLKTITTETIKTATSNVKSLATLEKTLSEIFDAQYYAEENPDVVASVGLNRLSLLNHYATFGIFEGRKPSKDFDFNINVYYGMNKDLQSVYSIFDADCYSVANSLINHYLTYGQKEGRPCKFSELDIDVLNIKTGEKILATREAYSSESENTNGASAGANPSFAVTPVNNAQHNYYASEVYKIILALDEIEESYNTPSKMSAEEPALRIALPAYYFEQCDYLDTKKAFLQEAYNFALSEAKDVIVNEEKAMLTPFVNAYKNMQTTEDFDDFYTLHENTGDIYDCFANDANELLGSKLPCYSSFPFEYISIERMAAEASPSPSPKRITFESLLAWLKSEDVLSYVGSYVNSEVYDTIDTDLYSFCETLYGLGCNDISKVDIADIGINLYDDNYFQYQLYGMIDYLDNEFGLDIYQSGDWQPIYIPVG